SAYLLAGLAAKLAGVPVVIAGRRNERSGDIYLPWLEKVVNRLVDAVFVVSKAVAEDAVSAGLVSSDKIYLIYNGIDLAPFATLDVCSKAAQIRQQFNDEDNCVLAGVVANLTPRKGHSNLLQAAVHILIEQPKIKFLLIGRDDGCRTELEQMSRDLGISDAVIFLGERHDIPVLLAAMDLQILPSRVEGFPVVALEGMASGLPLIVTDVGGSAEAVQDGVTGLVVPPANPEHLARAILCLGGNKALRQQMGQAGKARVRELFSIARIVEEHQHRYEQLVIDKGLVVAHH
ncbi:MAG: glycosyltransferase, partial [Chloroflexota bacterium]